MPASFDDALISADLPVLRQAAIDSFGETERVLKRFERIKGETFVPVLNELRYAGRHFIDAARLDDENAIRRNLFSAYRHCKRASFDVREIAISYLLVEVHEFVARNYDLETILSVMPDYRKLKENAANAQMLLRRLGNDNEKVPVELVDKSINDLLEFDTQVVAKEQDIRLIEKNKGRRKLAATVFNLISVGIGILGLIVAFVK